MSLVCELAWGIRDNRTENPYALMSLHSDLVIRITSLQASELHRLCSRGHGGRPYECSRKTNRKMVCPSSASGRCWKYLIRFALNGPDRPITKSDSL